MNEIRSEKGKGIGVRRKRIRRGIKVNTKGKRRNHTKKRHRKKKEKKRKKEKKGR